MEKDFFKFARQAIEQATAEARFDLAHNRTAAVRCFGLFLGKEELSFDELSTELVS